MTTDLASADTAPQQATGPRPLPLFLELVRQAAERDPVLAANALAGLAAYQREPRPPRPHPRQVVAAAGGAALRSCGGAGPPIVLVPSLINPPTILDLEPQISLAEAMAPAGHVFLLDWGPAHERRTLDLGDHVEQLLIPLLKILDEPATLVGYCLGGTLALAAAALQPVRGVATMASPWRFAAYAPEARSSLRDLWQQSRVGAEALGTMPMEVLQAAFWSLDPGRVVTKFARLADAEPGSAELRRFVALEDWANGGEPLPLPAARELIEDLFMADLPGRGDWRVRGEAIVPTTAATLHFTASNDRIVPAATVAPGKRRACSAGHVGMIAGRNAIEQLHRPLREWLARVAPRR